MEVDVKGPLKRAARKPVRHPPHRHAPVRTLPHLPAVCLAAGTVCLNAGLFLALCASRDIQTFFYEPRGLAVMHALALGWTSLAITGVLYRYVPTLTKQALRWPWLGRLQVGAFIAGVTGMVTHFWIGQLSGMAWSAAVVFVSIILLLVLLLPLLLRAPQYDATVIGIGAALFCFCGGAGLGVMYAFGKTHPFIGGDVFSNIAAHAHLALLGWVGLTICAVSYRMIATFALPEVLFPRPARLQVLSLSVIVPLLVGALLARSTLVMPLAVAAAASVLWYVVNVLRLLRLRRLPLDWSIRHVQAAMVHLCIAVVCGLAFVFEVDVRSALGAHLAVAYAGLALLGWVSNFIIGVGGRLAPGPSAVPGAATRAMLSVRIQALLFWAFNLGVAGIVLAALGNSRALLLGATGLTLVATLLFARAIIGRAVETLSSARVATHRAHAA
jgi:hypothetical protein